MASTSSGLREGWNVVAAAPDRYTNDNDALLHNFGQEVGMAFGTGGAPVVAWANLLDSPSNGFTISTSLLDPAAGWAPPTDVIRARLAPSGNGRLFTIAGDPATGVVAIALERRDDNGNAAGIDVLLSGDSGRTWTRTSAVDGEAYLPSVAVTGSAVLVAYANADGYAMANAVLPPLPRTDPAVPVDASGVTWAVQPLPGIEGFVAADVQPSVAVSENGRVGVATLLASTTGRRRAVAYTAIDAGTAPTSIKALELDGVVPGSSSVAVAFRGVDPVVAAAFEPRPDPSVLAILAASTDGGATFGPSSTVPRQLSERAPYAVSMTVAGAAARTDQPGTTATTAATPAGRTVLVYKPDSADAQAGRCGVPRTVSSEDLVTWQTCGPSIDGVAPATAVQPGNRLPDAVTGPDGGLYLAVANRNRSARVPVGIVVWRDG
ncbi:MAG: hypothetical protein HYX32_09360 [Actinobacteria bacterium]|nr:hypothetical protein [Actinomycetota bacterium]